MRAPLLLSCSLLFACGPVPATVDAGPTLPDASVTLHPDAGPVATVDAGVDAGLPLRTLSDFWANTQWPPYLTLAVNEHATIYGQVYVAGGTEALGAMADLEAELGYGAAGSEPSTWAWTAATFNTQKGNNDEFKAELGAPTSGVFEYAFRYRVRGASWAGHGEWLLAGVKGPTLLAGEAGLLAVKGGRVRVDTQNLMCVRDDPAARLEALAVRWAAMNVDVITVQEVCDEAPLGNTAALLAQKLAQRTGRPWRHLYEQTHLANNTTPEGLGVLTALPIAASATTLLPTQEFPRRALLAVLATPVGMLVACSTHFSFRPEDAAFREQQAQAVLAFVGDWQSGSARPPGTAALIAGDFNTTPLTPPVQVFTQGGAGFVDAWASTHPQDPGFSYPSSAPTERIDYLLVRGGPTVGTTTHEFTAPYTGTSYVSDHSGFGVELQ